MRFTKMQGAGNDYVYIDAVSRPELEHAHNWPALTVRMSDRHTGVGSDGVILICRPRTAAAHARMRMFNADGTESEMCGNGLRCVGRFCVDRLKMPAHLLVETGRGILALDCGRTELGLFHGTVDMGVPAFAPESIPVDLTACEPAGANHWRLIGEEGEPFTFVSTGNPHAVAFIAAPPNLGAVRERLRTLGSRLERHPAFPRRANIHWAWCASPRQVTMITWERGAGLTQACGTGACAVLAAGVLTGRLDRRAAINVPGGVLSAHWPHSADGAARGILLTGPAEFVFDGDWSGGEPPR